MNAICSLCGCRDVSTAFVKDGMELLADRPYLGIHHEEAVFDLLVMAPELPFLREVSSALLLTLWENLQESGARTGSDLASLALLFKEDVNQSRRLAALRHLLTADGGRYKELVVQEAIDRHDPALVRELALAISRKLPPAPPGTNRKPRSTYG